MNDSRLTRTFNNTNDDVTYSSTSDWYSGNCSWADAVSWGCNSTRGAGTNTTDTDVTSLVLMAVTSVVLALIILATIVGNVFVIAAIIIERNLQNVANYLVASLAVADLMVACLVMPLGAVYEVSQGWILGPELCDMWTSSDVLCSSASILHLVAIATDRYWAVTNVDYIHIRNEKRIFTMIFLVWGAALVVSLAPQLGWKDPDYLARITQQQKCLVSQDLAYQIFATCSTFYVPLAVILILYWKIFQTARRRIRRRREPPPPRPTSADGATPSGRPVQSARDRRFVKKRFLNLKKCNQRTRAETIAAALLLTEGQSTSTVDTLDEEPRTTAFTINEKVPSSVSPEKSSSTTVTNGSKPERAIVPALSQREKKESLEAKRERKAAKTLAIITGAFVFCWLPFFIMALVMPICQSCVISDYLASFFLWLGYFNSTLNPVIYTIFSPDFRQAFARILFGTHRRGRNKKF
ncbi:PREDICTED: 5-hydroxytryptamine receptor [Papilio xuthus]|uniref:5-hydroxytryptamine receptor n=1 Tax=Papilio xuthus TaxID=66420 RepID=Q5TLF3_PAPXU|nr:PREDICTED: 5-hydroxytryptamine receptor [Papilio xuthus]KPI98646.1 5-hydroxytryptamine receptor [Papilio xuthus]BAD72868.1 serotonin receptor [Papilio xuthus]